jgi:hypothetical protein
MAHCGVMFSLALILALCAAEGAIKYATFRSPPITLKSGQVANTFNNWGPLEWVKGDVAIRHFDGKIVDDSGKFVPLTEIYVHHWILFQMDASRQYFYPNGGLCSNLASIFGIGAELFHVEYNYKAPYAVISKGSDVWTANMHLIRTTNVPDVQSCIECHCPFSQPPLTPFGGIQCCPDRSMCWGMANSTINDPKNYYLEYKIGYVDITKDVVPLTIFSLDVTATHTIDCQLEYQVPAVPEGQAHVKTSKSVIPGNWSVVFLEPHLHIGGVNFSVAHYRNGQSLGTICKAYPTYGTGGDTPGNESGYLVGLDTCNYDPPYELLAGDALELTSVYDSRTLAGGHAWHEGTPTCKHNIFIYFKT